MKLHEVEFLRGSSSLCRFAVPGGWLYAAAERGPFTYGSDCHAMRVVNSAPKTFVPDPTAEHVVESQSKIVAEAFTIAEAGYTKAVADIWPMVDEELRTREVPALFRMRLLEKVKALRFSPTSQTRGG